MLMRGVERALPYLQQAIAQACETRGISPQDVVLLGFSQGAAMALHMGLLSPVPYRGVLAYSGVCALPNTAPYLLPSTPVCLIHGEEDDVVPIATCTALAATLNTWGVPLTVHRLPGVRHTIDAEGLNKGVDFLRRIGGDA